MNQKTDIDRILVNSYLEYKKTGKPDQLLKQADFWVQRFAVRKYSLDEDGRSEVLLNFIQRIESFVKIYETQGYRNFPAFAFVFWKHLVFNQWKKEKKRSQKEAAYLDPDRLEGAPSFEPGQEKRIDPFRIFLRDIWEKGDSRGILIFKLKHNLYLERKEILLLKRILLASGNSVSEFLKERKEKRFRCRNKELLLLEKLESSHQIRFSRREGAIFLSSRLKEKFKKKLLKADSIYTFLEIAIWFGWNEHGVKRLYHQTMNSLRRSGIDSEEDLSQESKSA
ncbi:sigma-70 family RNA polymerase sigma factor [Leptospira sp. 201903070]|uniref:Sigma-70 family RNA polymerase sigma factor n=1 Tax=Leptospira ainlahdjerensis TaxID=2810033 RepID=A0ABS2UCT4_9LEPT|nr:sigma-70 family RNA polymerase sigma factor [Leptospira ainlahdjerensis]MBM9577052.1 sigma-70 family RNA polymerase sigma factor [Leptospira ainlahdjerensis]